ncbi:Rhamnosyl O-methyltransferase/Cephalosporin hydroxylase [Trypanosoma melophagium]|uniref:Rhamnosyl O-methyltransferase/Cephalosporin hydroxylase n=1 Tax=Trypanosoma melophagium TaxID=715481 RepID=UPI003519F3B6|nr:Rhamnosyl O-methyltransferase/Cephalosporin hydroxylase [Trypanosoma melophagium]
MMKRGFSTKVRRLQVALTLSLLLNVVLLRALYLQKSSHSLDDSEEAEDVLSSGNKNFVSQMSPVGGKTSGKYNGEDGWVGVLERVPIRTLNTFYNPDEDEELYKHPKRYGRSPVPKGSWKVRVAPGRVLSMDEVAFAYDLWFEENRIFSTLSWFGVQMQQDPSDAIVIQDMLWRVKPDLIIEIGTNTGGSAIFYATIMKAYNPQGKIVTLDVKPISNWVKSQVMARCVGCILGTEHPWWNDGMIHFINGRITTSDVQSMVDRFVANASTVVVIEDASHRYPDTLQNIQAVHKYVTPGSYLLVQDTKMDRFVTAAGARHGNYRYGPMRSIDEFLAKNKEFVIDRRFEYLIYSQHHRGFLRKLKRGEIV